MKRIGFWIMLGLLALSSYTSWRLKQQKLADEQRLADQSAQIEKLETELKKFRHLYQQDSAAQRQAIESLRQSLKTEQDSLATLELDRNRSRNGGIGGDDPTRFGDPIQKQASVVAEVQQQLLQIEEQRRTLGNAQKLSLGATRSQTTATAQQLTATIQAGQQNLANLSAQVLALEPHRIDAGVNEQITQLEQQMTAQKTQIQELRTERQGVTQSARGEVAEINGQAGAQLRDLQASESQMRQRLAVEKAGLEDLKKGQAAARTSLSSQKAALDRLEKAYQAQKNKVAEIKADLEDRERRWQETRSN